MSWIEIVNKRMARDSGEPEQVAIRRAYADWVKQMADRMSTMVEDVEPDSDPRPRGYGGSLAPTLIRKPKNVRRNRAWY